ncbi:MAG TPA: hypothetical protein VKX49_12795 [Bryobacteraceae bacterium]|nr:hypothetical protein [Bryobacteraceae bacterium]
MHHLFLLLLLAQHPLIVPPELSAEQKQAEDLDRAELEFDHYWATYLLSKHGCPLNEKGIVVKPLTKADCTAPRKILNQERERAWELVRKVFPEHFKK